ncbi:MAG: small ribosomal subunit Rsm22 family protein [Pseudobdellovibrionaceae bacterium]|nr:small ribosomal subunit Rsm22 family protein [Pseudobdellovibrionaceae bacterium]
MDWNLIHKMRQGFLDTDGHLPDYWHDERWLSAYDQTLAERIRWKWQAVLEALAERLPQVAEITRVVDWGCGTGIATRSLLGLPLIQHAHVSLFDRSAGAMRFAAQQIKKECPGHTVELMKKFQMPTEPFVLLVSHVLSELDDRSLQDLQTLSAAAALVLWVEPGRTLESRRLSHMRDRLVESHHILGPCRHSQSCGVLQAGRENDWCHFFAPVPREVHHSAFWCEFSQRMKVDLRSLPVSWLAAVRPAHYTGSVAPADEALILSRPRAFKGYCRWVACTNQGICSGDFQKKHAGDIFQALSEPEFMTVLPRNKLIIDKDG